MISAFVHTNIEMILLLTGIPTAGMLGMFIAPRLVLRLAVGVEPGDHVGVFFARGWGAVVGAIGLLLIAAASMPGLRETIMAAASFTKGSFVVMIAANLGNALGRGLILVLIFDAVCVILYIAYLLG